jgi:hypothetical protein
VRGVREEVFSMTTQQDILTTVSARDGLAIDAARVLIEMWAWPLGMAIKPAYDKAFENHPHWQAWRDEKRDSVPSLTEWQASMYKVLSRA